jgi:rRNA-processing protein FCF1
MKVILDTNILSADHTFNKTDMVILRRLCNEGKIELIIPEIILREFVTQEQEKAMSSGKNVLKEINKYCKTVYGTEKNPLMNFIKDIQVALTEANKKIQERIDAFVHETNASILIPNIDDYKETFDRYFKGEQPFKVIKARDDIPDGLAFVQIKKIKDDELVFISNDERLREAVESEDITVFSSLVDFIKTDKINKFVEINKLDDLIYYALPQILENENLLSLFHEALENELPYKTVHDEKIPDDNNEGTITGVIGIDPTEFTKDEITKHGSGLFTIPFYCEIDAYLEYYVFKADYYSLDEDRIMEISIDDWNDHYYEAEEEYPLICTGVLGLQFNPNMLCDEINNNKHEILIDELKISFNDIEISVKDF